VRLLFALPDRDFDPTEAAVTWRILTAAGHDASFATPSGKPGQADPSMITGQGLDVWGRIPVLKQFPLVGLMLRANHDAREAYALMERDPRYNAPLRYDELRAADFDALVLPGGHYARGMHVYLESPVLQAFVADVFESGKPVAAICHGAFHRPLRPLWKKDDGAHAWARECRRGDRPRRPLLGTELLSHVRRSTGRTGRLS
jgi:putative intracellular protease/amidase